MLTQKEVQYSWIHTSQHSFFSLTLYGLANLTEHSEIVGYLHYLRSISIVVITYDEKCCFGIGKFAE